MARKPNLYQLEQIYNKIDENPGKRAGFIAHMLGLHRSHVSRSLATLEERGYLLSEDEKGGLRTYRNSRLKK